MQNKQDEVRARALKWITENTPANLFGEAAPEGVREAIKAALTAPAKPVAAQEPVAYGWFDFDGSFVWASDNKEGIEADVRAKVGAHCRPLYTAPAALQADLRRLRKAIFRCLPSSTS